MFAKQFITLDNSNGLTFSRKIQFLFECLIYEVASLVVTGILATIFFSYITEKIIKYSAISCQLSAIFQSPTKKLLLDCVHVYL